MWTELKGRTTGRRAEGFTGVSVSVTPSNEKGTKQFRCGISVDVMREMRWVIGDRLNVMVDVDTKRVLLARVPSGRVCLCPSSGKTSDHAGKVHAANVSVTADKFLSDTITEYRRIHYDATPDGLVLHLNSKAV